MNTEPKRAGRFLLVTAAGVAIVIGAIGQGSADWTHVIPGYQNTWIGSLSPVIADLDGDGGARQIVMLTQGTPQRQAAGLVIMESDGSERAYLELEHTCGSRALASVADLDSDGSLEIVAECLQNPNPWLIVFDHHGVVERSTMIDLQTSDDLYSSFAVEDIDLDGDYELAYIGWSSGGIRLLVMDDDGTTKPGFPVTLTTTQTSEGGVPAIGDLNGSPPLDIAANWYRRDPDGGGDYIYTSWIAAFSGDGSELWRHRLPERGPSDPVIGDLDGDGLNEVVVTSQCGLHVVSSDGSLKSFVLGTRKIHSNVALADLDGDDDLEIVFGYGTTLLALHQDGSQLFSFVPDWVPQHPPLVADVDGDGGLDVVFNSDNEIYAVDSSGALVGGFPLPMVNIIAYNAPAIDDVDGDGFLELVSCSNWGDLDDIDYGTVHLWDLSGPGTAETQPWPTFQHDPTHSGRYEARHIFADGFESGDTTMWSVTVQ